MPNIAGRPQARGLERRRQLIEAAAELFALEGYRGTGIAAVAERAGVSAPALLHHFKTKQALLQAVLEQRDESDREMWEALLAPGGLSTIRGLASVAKSWQRNAQLSRLYTVLLAENLSAGAPMHDWFAGRQEFIRDGLRDAIAAGQARGEIRSDADPRIVAIEITAFMDGLGAEWQLDPERTPVTEVLQDFFDRMADSLAADGPGDG